MRNPKRRTVLAFRLSPQVSADQTTLMRPICGTVPKIHVRNEAGEKEYAEKMLPAAQRLYQFGLRNGGFHPDQARRASRKNADKYMVSLYDFRVQGDKVVFQAQNAMAIKR